MQGYQLLTLFSYIISSSLRTVCRSVSCWARISRRASSRRCSYSLSRRPSTSSIVVEVRTRDSSSSCGKKVTWLYSYKINRGLHIFSVTYFLSSICIYIYIYVYIHCCTQQHIPSWSNCMVSAGRCYILQCSLAFV